MRRRTIAALAVFAPVVVIAALKIFYPLSYEMLSGYMVAVALIFKSALVSFFMASKLKVVAFLKGLTLLQGIILLAKRWFLDNVFSRWLKRNIIDHIMVGIRELKHYYKALNLRAKITNLFIPIVFSIISAAALYLSGNLANIVLFTELKILIVGLSKTILMVGGKFIGFAINSWITPILEVFALSYLLTWLEQHLGSDNPIVRALNWIGEQVNRLLLGGTLTYRRYIDPLINRHVSRHSKQLMSKLSHYIHNKKIAHEYEQFAKFEQAILSGHIDAYHHHKGMEKITDKTELYSLINQRTDDNLDIVAFVSRNDAGELLNEEVDDSFYHDIFLLEGMASSHRHGVRQEETTDPDHSDFWVFNSSKYPATIGSSAGYFPSQAIEPNSVILVKTSNPQDYAQKDIYFEYQGIKNSITPVAP